MSSKEVKRKPKSKAKIPEPAKPKKKSGVVRQKKRKHHDEDEEDDYGPTANPFFEDQVSEDEDDAGSEKLAKEDVYYDADFLKRKNAGLGQKKILELEERAKRQEERRLKKEQRKLQKLQKVPDSSQKSSPSKILAPEEISSDEEESEDSIEHDYFEDDGKKLYPSVKDPKLWRVRVKKGFERTAAMALMNKQIAFAKGGQPFDIISATFIENLENFIFVESFKIDSVREAINGLSFCYQRIDILPLNEMTSIYEDQDSKLVLPEEKTWVRIKNGLYQDDVGICVRVVSNNKIFVKLIPRLDPLLQQNEANFRREKRIFQRFEQCPFRPSMYPKQKIDQGVHNNHLNKHFFRMKNNLFRKGFLVKDFTMKDIESQNVKPTLNEREEFMSIFNDQEFRRDDDSSSDDEETTKKFILLDSGQDLVVGDKIFIEEGELKGVIGKITNFGENGSSVDFLPENIEGYTETLTCDKAIVQKYFQTGDYVRIIEGKLQGETATVLRVHLDDVSKPYLMVESSKREVQLSTTMLKSIGKQDMEDFRMKQALNGKKGVDQSYKVGDIIEFDQGKSIGFVIEVDSHQLRVVTEHDIVNTVQINRIIKKVPTDKRKLVRDSMGNSLQFEDVITVVSKQTKYSGKKGIVKNIHGNYLFLWDESMRTRSNFFYVEQARNVLIKGHELLRGSQDRKMQGVANMNRIARHKLLNQWVRILRGEFKGQHGRVTHIVGELAEIEMSIRAKKVHLDLQDLEQINPEAHLEQIKMQVTGPAQQNGDQMAGGQTVYAGGQTVYDMGKTPFAPEYNDAQNYGNNNYVGEQQQYQDYNQYGYPPQEGGFGGMDGFQGQYPTPK